MRRAAGALLLALYVIASPTYACPLHCLLRAHDRDAPSQGSTSLSGAPCHVHATVVAHRAALDRDPAPARTEPAAHPDWRLAAGRTGSAGRERPGAPVLPAPPSPPPRG